MLTQDVDGIEIQHLPAQQKWENDSKKHQMWCVDVTLEVVGLSQKRQFGAKMIMVMEVKILTFYSRG
jgi:hypothetical protein